ncbi:MAG: DNA-binding domain-containing protein [Gammaproteobacteria bacterium]
MSFTSLSRIQGSFSNALLAGDRDNAVLEFIKGSSDSFKNKRLDIYRNNVFYSLTSALADLYPVVMRLVGQDFFNATAKAYLQMFPPRRAAMVLFGEDFPDFLREFEHTASLPWLADVARLELARHQSYHAKDAVSLTTDDFSAIQPDKLVDIKLELHPTTRLLYSPFPILRIWHANQNDNEPEETIDLDSGGTHVWIHRPDYEVLFREQQKCAYTFLKTLSEGETLGDAVLAAQAIDPEFIPTSLFARSISSGLFIKITEGY